MTNYELLRKDFTIEIERCHFCNKKLTLQKVYVVKNTNTGEVFSSGYYCAEKNVNVDLKSIPDFTRYIRENLKDEIILEIIKIFVGMMIIRKRQ